MLGLTACAETVASPTIEVSDRAIQINIEDYVGPSSEGGINFYHGTSHFWAVSEDGDMLVRLLGSEACPAVPSTVDLNEGRVTIVVNDVNYGNACIGDVVISDWKITLDEPVQLEDIEDVWFMSSLMDDGRTVDDFGPEGGSARQTPLVVPHIYQITLN